MYMYYIMYSRILEDFYEQEALWALICVYLHDV